MSHPFGETATGLLIYTIDGWMSGQVMRSGRTNLVQGYRQSGSVGEVLDAFEGYIAYCGRYRVDEEAGEVIHIVEASLFPNWVGSEQRRQYEIAANRLVLRARTAGQNKKTMELQWRRVGKSDTSDGRNPNHPK